MFDARDRSVTYIDAGHGHWLVKRAHEHRRPGASGIPLGIDPDARYPAQRLALGADERIVLYSDGMTEQRSREGEMFGADRLARALRDSTGVEDGVRLTCEARGAFAQTQSWDDDASIASITWSV